MATLRTPPDNSAFRRVYFQDGELSHASAPKPVRNYSNPYAQRPQYDPNDSLRLNAATVAHDASSEAHSGKKGGRLLKRQKSGDERPLRRRFFGFRSKKSSDDKSQAVDPKFKKTDGKGAKYVEVISTSDRTNPDARDLHDSAWTTAFTTARHSLELPDPFDHDGEQMPERPAEDLSPRTMDSRPPSSRYSMRLTNDHIHSMIGELQDRDAPAQLPNISQKHISSYYSPQISRFPSDAKSREDGLATKKSPRQSLHLSKSHDELQRPLAALNAELEAMRMMKRYPTPDLVGATGANDPRLALSSHPTASPSRPHTAGAGSQLRTVSSAKADLNKSDSSLSDSQKKSSSKSSVRPAHGPAALSSLDKIDTSVSTIKAEDALRSLLQTADVDGTKSVGATSPQSSTRKGSHPTTNPAKHSNRGSWNSDAFDAEMAARYGSVTTFLDSPRPSTPSDRATERANRVRDRKLRDRKPSGSAAVLPADAPADADKHQHHHAPSRSASRTRTPYREPPPPKQSPVERAPPPLPSVPATAPDVFAAPAKERRHRSPASSSPRASLAPSRVMLVAETMPAPAPAPRPSPGPSPRPSFLGVPPALPEGKPSAPPPQQPRRGSADMRTRMADLERRNQLLEAALAAVLQTAGRLNGCPCQGQGAGLGLGLVGGGGDALDAYRASRLSVHSQRE